MNQILADVTRTLPPTDVELAAVVRNFHTARVLVIGDVILDRYISGAVHRLSPEAPIPVLRPATNQCTLGGAANVALNIATNTTLADLQAKRIEEMGGPAVAYAKSKVGNGYVYGAAGPSVFDCSGLTMAAWSQAGVSLPHSSSAQYSSGRHISESELQPGDLVFYYSPISHVGMYIGNGQIVNALNPGAGVVISGLHDMPYVGAVRPGA